MQTPMSFVATRQLTIRFKSLSLILACKNGILPGKVIENHWKYQFEEIEKKIVFFHIIFFDNDLSLGSN